MPLPTIEIVLTEAASVLIKPQTQVLNLDIFEVRGSVSITVESSLRLLEVKIGPLTDLSQSSLIINSQKATVEGSLLMIGSVLFENSLTMTGSDIQISGSVQSAQVGSILVVESSGNLTLSEG